MKRVNLNSRENERARSLSARFGITPKSSKTKCEENKRFELHEGILPQCSNQLVEEDFALFDSHCQEINPTTYSSISSSSIDCAESLATKNSDLARRRRELRKFARAGLPTSSLEEQQRKEEERLVSIQTEENVRRKMELLLATALSRKIAKTETTTKYTNERNESKMAATEMSNFNDNQMELSGIPHDFHQDQMASTSAMMPSYHQKPSSELIPINYENEGQNVDKFDIYDRCGTVMDIGNNDEFDFGLGLENEFISGGSDIGDGNVLMHLSDDSSFLEELSSNR